MEEKRIIGEMTAMPAPRTSPITSVVEGHATHNELPGQIYYVSVLFMYHPDDPYSVTMDITVRDYSVDIGADEYHVQRWEIARETVYQAAVWGTPSGCGDLHASAPDEESLVLRLWDPRSCPDHQAHFDIRLPRSTVRSFIRRTLRAVPAGTESAYLDIDADLERLFA